MIPARSKRTICAKGDTDKEIAGSIICLRLLIKAGIFRVIKLSIKYRPVMCVGGDIPDPIRPEIGIILI
jgi:hypothetical protein